MKKLFSHLAAVCLLAGFASASVVVNTPTEGTTYSSLHTSVKGDSSITTLEEWIDGVKVFQTVKCAPNCVIERNESLSNGSHNMVIVGKKNGRVVSKQPIDFSVNSTSSPSTPPSGSVLYQEDYTNGLGAMQLSGPYGQCSATAGSTSVWKNGMVEQHYVIPANTCNDHQDANMYIEYVLPGGKTGSGVEYLCRKEDYYFVTPAPGASKQIQRKMMWLNAGRNPSSGNAMWQLVLTTDGSPTTGRPSVRFAYQDALQQGYTLYGADADPDFTVPMPTAYNGGIFEFDYERKYNVEFCAKKKTVGVENAEIHLYIDGAEVFRKTTWGGARGKNAFPINDFDSSNFTFTWGGQQTDRIGVDKAVDEYRRIDNTVICIGKC